MKLVLHAAILSISTVVANDRLNSSCRRAPPLPQVEDTEASAASLVDVDSPHISSVSSDYSEQATKTRTQADREAREAEERTRAAAKKTSDKASEYSREAQNKTSEYSREARNKASDYSEEASNKASDFSKEASNKASEYSEEASKKASKLSKETREVASNASQRASELTHEAADKASDIYNHPSENYDKAKRAAAKKSEQAKESAIHTRDDISANRDNPVVVGNAVVITVMCAVLGMGVYKKYSAGDLSWKVAGLWAGAVGVFAVGDYYLSMYLFRNKYPKK